MPLFRWVRDLGRPSVPGAYEVRHTIVRVTERDISSAEAAIEDADAADAVFVGSAQDEFVGTYRLGTVVFTIPMVQETPVSSSGGAVLQHEPADRGRHA